MYIPESCISVICYPPKKNAEPAWRPVRHFQAGVLYPAPGKRQSYNKPKSYIPLSAGGKLGRTMNVVYIA